MKVALQHIVRLVERIAIIANAVGTLVVLALVLVSMVLIVFLQLPDVVRVNRLTRSDGFLSIAGTRWPWLASYLNRVINFIAAIFMLLVAIAIWPEFVEMWETKDYFGVPGVFTAPWWPVKLVIFLSASLCFILFVLKFFLPSGALSSLSENNSAEVGIK